MFMLKSPRKIDELLLWFWSHMKTLKNAYRTCNECFLVGIETLPTEHLEWFHRLYAAKEIKWV